MTIEFGLRNETSDGVLNTQHAPLVALAAHYQQHNTLQPLESVDVRMKTVTYSPASKLQQIAWSILAGLRSSAWQHIDDPVTRVDGQNQYCHIVCNPLYTAYLTTPNKDRLTIVDVLRNGRERSFMLNAEARSYLERMSLAASHRERLQQLPY